MIQMNKETICDYFIVLVEVVNQEKELLIMLRWKILDIILQVVHVVDRLEYSLLLRHIFFVIL